MSGTRCSPRNRHKPSKNPASQKPIVALRMLCMLVLQCDGDLGIYEHRQTKNRERAKDLYTISYKALLVRPGTTCCESSAQKPLLKFLGIRFGDENVAK